jgi:hypothetical protein
MNNKFWWITPVFVISVLAFLLAIMCNQIRHAAIAPMWTNKSYKEIVAYCTAQGWHYRVVNETGPWGGFSGSCYDRNGMTEVNFYLKTL